MSPRRRALISRGLRRNPALSKEFIQVPFRVFRVFRGPTPVFSALMVHLRSTAPFQRATYFIPETYNIFNSFTHISLAPAPGLKVQIKVQLRARNFNAKYR
jgi:hypothetical protein